jgi:Secretion system C-terminal sorting domain
MKKFFTTAISNLTLGLVIAFTVFGSQSLFAITIFSENIGTPSATTAITTYAGGTAPATFQNKGMLTYSNGAATNPADVRVSSPSSTYSGASGGGNVYFTATSGNYGFSIESINASSYTSITLAYGYRKELASGHATFSVDYWDGATWVTIANTSAALFNETATAAAGWYAAKTLTLPAGAQINGLKIRFVKTGTLAIRIDDFVLSGTASSVGANTISAGSGIEPATISSLVTTQAASVLNFDIAIQDDGATPANDALDTKITQFIFSQGTGNTVTNWTQAIAGAVLSDGTNTMTGVVGSNTITFASVNPATLGLVADNATKTYTLKIWLGLSTIKTTADGLKFVFRLQSSGVSADVTGSQFEATQDQNSGSSNNVIDVVATKLAYVTNTSNANTNVAMAPAVAISADDANGIRDLGFSGVVVITSTGNLTASPVGVASTSGLATFSTLTHTAFGTALVLTASSAGMTDIASNPFDIAVVTGVADYFRSNVASGSWGTAGSWESSSDNSTWITSTLVPTSAAALITIRNGHTITMTTANTVDDVVIESGGKLALGVGTVLTINNGAAMNDVDIQNGGTLQFVTTNSSYSTVTTIATGANVNIATGGKIQVGDGTGTLTGSGFGTLASASTGFTWNNGAIFEWNTSSGAIASSGVIWFPSATSTVPIFRINAYPTASSLGGGTSATTTLNGILEVNTPISWQGTGTKTFRNGITGTSTMTSTAAGAFAITGSTAELGGASGTLTLSMGTAGLNVTSPSVQVTSNVAASAGKVTFNGTGTQSIFGNGFSIGNMTVNNTNGINISSPLTVTGELAMTSGNINTTSTNLLTLGTAATLTGGGATAFVNGPMAKMTNSTTPFTFPLGKVTTYRTIGITPSTSAATTYTAEYMKAAPSNQTSITAPIQSVLSLEYFDLNASPATPATVTLSYDMPAGFCSDLAHLTLAHYTAGSWKNEAATATGSLTTGSVTTTSPVTSYSPFALGSLDAVASPLPITLKSFTAKATKKDNLIAWETAVEENIRAFVVEKSENSKVWVALTTALPNATKRYETNDATPFKNTYYRLRIVENDGRENFSTILNVKSNNNGLDATVISTQKNQLRLTVQNNSNEDALISIIDMNGRVVANYEVSLSKENNDFTFDTALQSGMYALKIATNSGAQMSKLLNIN